MSAMHYGDELTEAQVREMAAKQTEELRNLRALLAESDAEVERLEQERPSKNECAYCGIQGTREQLMEHIKKCREHPLYQRAEAAEAKLVKAREAWYKHSNCGAVFGQPEDEATGRKECYPQCRLFFTCKRFSEILDAD